MRTRFQILTPYKSKGHGSVHWQFQHWLECWVTPLLRRCKQTPSLLKWKTDGRPKQHYHPSTSCDSMSVWGLLIGMRVGIKYQSTDDSEAVIWEEPIQNEWWLNEAGIFELCAWLVSLTCQRVSSRQFYWSFSSRMVWVSSLALTSFVNLRREKIWISGQFQGLPGIFEFLNLKKKKSHFRIFRVKIASA